VSALPSARNLGRYEILAELGKGTMGTVYKALDPVLNRTVALKTINLATDDPEMADYKSRLFQEARAVASLNHPNIVTVYDAGENGDVPYLAMELLEGRDLALVISDGTPLPVQDAIDIALQVAEGLTYAHEHGVLHRDIKPANIMIVRDQLVKIADFGIARLRATQRSDGPAALGAPRYMSPEQVLGKRADHRSDIFSLGVVLYEMLTGCSPFAGADLNAILFQIVNLVAPAPSTMNPAVPAALDGIVAKALAKTPEDRYDSAKAFAEALRTCHSTVEAAQNVPPSIASQPVLPKIDPRAVTPLLATSYPQSRQSDGQSSLIGTSTLGVAKDFDSLAAMVRLAAQTGVAQSFAALASREEKPDDAEGTVHGTVVREQSSKLVAAASIWKKSDRLIFAASVATAVVVAALIVFV
jgi:serine/threonine protein kinase